MEDDSGERLEMSATHADVVAKLLKLVKAHQNSEDERASGCTQCVVWGGQTLGGQQHSGQRVIVLETVLLKHECLHIDIGDPIAERRERVTMILFLKTSL